MATGLIDIMKRASMDAVDNAQMCDLRFGTVISTSPLKVKVTNLFTIPESLLIVPEHLTDYEVAVTLDWTSTATGNHNHSYNGNSEETDGHNHSYSGATGESGSHFHSISGKKTMTIHNALKVNDKVALLRKQGGQSYFILDRI